MEGATDRGHAGGWWAVPTLRKPTKFEGLWISHRITPISGPASSLRGQPGLHLKCAVEQRLARQAHNLEVVGSIPAGVICSAKKAPSPGLFSFSDPDHPVRICPQAERVLSCPGLRAVTGPREVRSFLCIGPVPCRLTLPKP